MYVDDNNTSDDEWVPHARHKQKKAKRQLLRQKNITVEGDNIVSKILEAKHFYKYLRTKISGIDRMYCPTEAKQTLRNSAIFIAFAILKNHAKNIESEGSVFTWDSIVKAISEMTTGVHNILYKYTKFLSEQYYKPSTITHNLDYIKTAVEWTINEHDVKYSQTFFPYLKRLRSKVPDYIC